MNNHANKTCRKRKRESSHAKQCNDGSNHEFFFMLRNNDVSDIQEIDASAFLVHFCWILVDTGATYHVVNYDSGFISVDEHFNPENHYIELANGSKTCNLALKKGTVEISWQHAYLPPIHDRNLYLAKRWYRRVMLHNSGVQDYVDNHTHNEPTHTDQELIFKQATRKVILNQYK